MITSARKGKELVSMVAVKEFMIQALDESTNGSSQKKLKEEFIKFFEIVKATEGYAEAERLADEEKGQLYNTTDEDLIRSP